MNKNRAFLRRIPLHIAMAVTLLVLLFSLAQIVRCLHEKEQRDRFHAQLAHSVVEAAPQDTEQEHEGALPEKSEETVWPAPPITVDLASLQAQYEDVVALIHCPDTPIDHPVVQGEDNLYYLDHMIDGRKDSGGTVFLDHRSDASMTDACSIVYGHNLRDGSIFSSLPEYSSQAYYDAHPILFYLTPEKNFVIDIFAGFVTQSNDRLYELPRTELARAELIEACIERSDIKTQTQPTVDDRLILLSTCSYAFEDARYVLAGVLREN